MLSQISLYRVSHDAHTATHLTNFIVFSSSEVEVKQLPESKNIVLSGKWDSPDKDKPLGGSHLYDKEFMEDESKQTWS